MNNEEQYLRDRVGQTNPFRVPEGYFNQLADKIISQLPTEQPAVEVPMEASNPASRLAMLRPWIYSVAASILIAVMVTSFFFRPAPLYEQPLAAGTSFETNYMDDAADYAMLDNAEIYACLAE